MNPTVDPTTGAYSPYSPYSSGAATAYNPMAQVPSSSALGSLGNTVNQGQGILASLNTQPAPAPAPQGKSPNLLERLLPTVGSILGGIAGAPLDPFTGGLASVGLAGLLGGGGKALENGLTGQKVLQGNDLTSGLESAAGQGIGKGVGALIGKGGSALSNLGANRAAAAASTTADQAAADEAARIGNEFASVKPHMAQVGPALEKLNSLGITNPTAADAQSIGNIYTGSNPESGIGVINFYKKQALDQAGGSVNLDSTMDNLHNTLASPENQVLGGEQPVTSAKGQLPKLPSNPATSIVDQVRGMLPGDTMGADGQLTQELSPQDGRSLLTKIGEQINATKPVESPTTGKLDPADVATNNVWKSIYNDVKQSVYGRPEVDAAVQGLKVGPDESAVIDDAIRSNGVTDPKVAANIKADLTNTLNNASSAQDLLSAEQPMVNVSKVGSIATKDTTNNPQLPRNVRAAKAGAKTGSPASSKLLGAGVDLGGAYEGLVGGHPAALLAPLAYNLMKNPAALQATGGLLSKIGSSALPGAAGQVVANSPNDIATPDNQSTIGANMQNPLQGSLLSQLLGQDLGAGREALTDPYLASNFSPEISQLSSLLPMAQKVAAAQASAQQLASLFNQAGGAQGPVGGLLSRLGQTLTGGPASFFGSNLGTQENQAAQGIAGVTGQSPGQIMTPQVTQNQPTAQAALQNIYSLIGALGGGPANNNSVLGSL